MKRKLLFSLQSNKQMENLIFRSLYSKWVTCGSAIRVKFSLQISIRLVLIQVSPQRPLDSFLIQMKEGISLYGGTWKWYARFTLLFERWDLYKL